MNRSTRRRLRRARQNAGTAPPDLSAFTPQERARWETDLLGYPARVELALKKRRQAAAQAPEPDGEPAPADQVAAAPPTVVEATPKPSPSTPTKVRNWWEEDPNYVPPPQHPYVEEHCRWRFRRAEDYDYDADDDDDDEWNP